MNAVYLGWPLIFYRLKLHTIRRNPHQLSGLEKANYRGQLAEVPQRGFLLDLCSNRRQEHPTALTDTVTKLIFMRVLPHPRYDASLLSDTDASVE